MYSFPQAIAILEEESLLQPIPKQAIVDAPLYVHHHNDGQIAMPPREDWLNFKENGELARILPSPITKTIQTAKALRGFHVYSVLMSDGRQLVTKKILASDSALLLILQVFDIDALLEAARSKGQPLNVWNKCYTVRPNVLEVPDSQPPMPDLVRVLAITTMHFIFSAGTDTPYRSSEAD